MGSLKFIRYDFAFSGTATNTGHTGKCGKNNKINITFKIDKKR